MLLRPNQQDVDSPVPVMNYYEHLVFEYIEEHLLKGYNEETLQDIACLALNHLPPRYIRHQVDLTFYMSPREHDEMIKRVENAMKLAISRVAGEEPA